MSAMCSVDWGCEFIGTLEEVKEHEKTHPVPPKQEVITTKRWNGYHHRYVKARNTNL